MTGTWAQLELAGGGVAYNFPALIDEADPSQLRLRISADTPVVVNAQAANGYELVLSPGRGAVAVTADSAAASAGGPGSTRRMGNVAVRGAGSSAVAAAVDDGGTLAPVPPGETETGEMTTGTASDTADGVDGTDCASGYSKTWINQDKFKQGWVPSKWMRTRSKGHLRWEVERTNETTMQVAYTTPSSGWAGGFTGSRTQSSSISWKPSVGNDAWKVFKIHWEYQRQRAECVYFEPETGYTSIYWLNHWRWSPTRVTGNKLLDTKSAVTCGSGARYRDTFGAETSVARGSVVTFSGWFTVAGVKLDARSADGDYETFSIWPNANTNVTACGNNDEPLYADLVQEVN